MNLPVVDMVQTGQNIQSLRQQRGITVRQLQGILGFATPQAIYNWQHGVSLPTVDNLVALASIFAVPVETILEIRVTAG
ncbi:MAG: helix-turn-helix transcriptional regulator [Clostridia bacterium]|nr:helix-turn-helix transcriptional regulator [Clostridia bacterium]